MYTVETYVDTEGNSIFDKWLDQLSDNQAVSRISSRIDRLQRGALGDCKPLRDGVWELRVDYGPGYRVYYIMTSRAIILLLCGGDKRRQSADIERAVRYLKDYKRRKS